MLEAGVVLADRYRIDRVLGQGGMGGVYEVMHLQLERAFALKEMLVEIPKPALREAAERQFRLEAQILHTLEHPGLPRLYDFFSIEGPPGGRRGENDRRYYLVMELIRGDTLDRVVAERELSERELLRWLHQICIVLKYLHTHNPPVTFRDLKPSNIMVTPAGHIKLIDFGIAKVWDAPDEAAMTRTGVRGLCTPGFAAPEQYGTGTDARTDIYALGATAWSLMTRTMPPTSVDLAAGRAELPSLKALRPDVSGATAEKIHWMMKLSLSQRPQSIEEVMGTFGFSEFMSPLDAAPQTEARHWFGRALTTLAGVAGGAKTLKREKGERPKRPSSRHSARTMELRPHWGLLGGGVAVVAVLAGLVGWSMSDHLPTSAGQASQPDEVSALVVVLATPNDTKLFDNGHLVTKIEVSAPETFAHGHHNLTFEHPGYGQARQTLDVKDGHAFQEGRQVEEVHAALTALDGRLRVTGTPHAHVTIDSQPVGTLPLAEIPTLHEGTHTVVAELAGYYRISKDVRVKADADAHVDLTLRAMPAPHVASRYIPRPAPRPASPHKKRTIWQRLHLHR